MNMLVSMSGARSVGTVVVAIAWGGGAPEALAHPWHRHSAGDHAEATQAHAEPDEFATEESPAVRPPFILSAVTRKATPSEFDIADAFAPFEKRKAVTTRRDQRWFYVESNGIPDHPLMVGIRNWQQQVPLPQPYAGVNAWRIPLHPVQAKQPALTKDRFLRGAIALAVNGIPIFNPLNNRGEDALAIGELDEYGGHCGRADDYHYHVAPVHLEKVVGKGMPIAYALDGYPVYGSAEPDRSPMRPLDALGGHDDGEGGYHYHAMPKYPYLIGGFRGEVVERDGQVDPQPQVQPIRPALGPLKGATIVGSTTSAADTRKVVYEVGGKKGSIEYTVTKDGSATFRFTDPAGRMTTESYAPRNRGGGGGQKGGPPRKGQKKPLQGAAAAGRESPRARIAIPEITVTSSAIGQDGLLPPEFTCDGAGISPPIEWQAGPPGTTCYALTLWHETPDGVKSYWVVYDIPANVTRLPKDSRNIGTLGRNDKGRPAYDPMCSQGPGRKDYHITVYALSACPQVTAAAVTRDGLLGAITSTALAEGSVTFGYERMVKP